MNVINSQQKIKILLVEDSKSFANLCMQILSTEESFETFHVESVMAAIECLLKEKFDLILLDLTLPDEHGFNTFMRVNEYANNTPVIIMSSIDDEELSVKIVQSGAQDYIVKSNINKESLIRSLRYAIERYKLLHENLLMKKNLLEKEEKANSYKEKLFTLLDSFKDKLFTLLDTHPSKNNGSENKLESIKKIKVLLVEDSKAFALLCHQILNKEGSFDIFHVGSVKTAIECLNREKFNAGKP